MVKLSERLKRRTIAVALVFLSLGILGSFFSRTLVEFFLMAELVVITAFYVFFSIIVPGLYPKKRNNEEIFLGGVARPPYIHEYELYVPKSALISEEEET
ncbi:MAG: hypothetical protein QW327_03380 [Candidatus Odinarchaeota archaeon]